MFDAKMVNHYTVSGKMIDQQSSSLRLKMGIELADTTSLGRLFQSLTTLNEKKLSRRSSLALLFLRRHPLPLRDWMLCLVNICAPESVNPLRILNTSSQVKSSQDPGTSSAGALYVPILATSGWCCWRCDSMCLHCCGANFSVDCRCGHVPVSLQRIRKHELAVAHCR